MKEPIYIESREEYEYATKRGVNPLLDCKRFKMDIRLRVEIQKALFERGRIDTMQANEKFYKYCWRIYPHYCQECMKPLKTYSSVFISHIMTRGAYPEMAHDIRNVNILCFEHHAQWENGDRWNMRIYPGNARIMELMKQEYQTLYNNASAEKE